MVLDPLTSDVTARALLEDALQPASEPVLTTEEVDRLFDLVATPSEDDPEVPVYWGRDLNRAAARGWTMKAAKVADRFNVSLPEGMRFEREQQYQHCKQMAHEYAVGALSVTGSTIGTSGRGIGSILLIGSHVDPEDV